MLLLGENITRTFGGLIIMAHRVNSQTLFKIPSIHIYILDIHIHIYDMVYIFDHTIAGS